MAGKTLGRLITAMVTPFDRNGAVNYDQLAKLARQLVEYGDSDALLVTGTTGEAPTLSHEEKIECWRTVKQAVGDRVPVVAGTGNYDTAASVALSREAEEVGADALLLVAPYYNNPPQEGLYQHFKTIADSVSLPCILYNVPSRTVRNMEAKTTLRLARVPNIIGVKEASGNLAQIADILRGAPEDFYVWSGNDSDTFPIMCMGGYGIISVASHVIGCQIKKMINATVESRLAEAGKLHVELMPFFQAIFPPFSPVASPGAIKTALNLAGFDVGGLRLPLIELDDHAKKALREVMAHYELDPNLSLLALA